MINYGKERGSGSLWEGREEGAVSGISKVAEGRRDGEFTERRKRGRQLRGKIKGAFFFLAFPD